MDAVISIRLGGRDRIHLHSPYSPDTIARCKKVPGSNWSKTAKAWTFPLTIETCRLLRIEFGGQLAVERDVSDWYRAEASRRETIGALAGAESAELSWVPTLAPGLAAAFASRPYQPVAARFIADARAVLVADEPGLGKTLEAIGGIIESQEPGPYLVISPKTAVESVWAREIPRWYPDARAVTVPEGRAERAKVLDAFLDLYGRTQVSRDPSIRYALDTTFVVVHPEMILSKKWWRCEECGEQTPWTKKPTPILNCGHRKARNPQTFTNHTFPQLFTPWWGAIVIDESHEILANTSGTPTQRRLGADLLRLRDGGVRIAQSGTPWRSRPENLWGTLNWLAPKVYSGKWRWIGTFWELGGYTGYEIGAMKPGMEELLWESLKPIVLRRTKGEVAQDLPPKTYCGSLLDPSNVESPIGVWLEMTPEQRAAYDSMAKTSAAALAGGDLSAVGTLAELTRLRQFATSSGRMAAGEFRPALPSNKFNWTKDFLDEMGYPGNPTGKIVIVSQFTQTLNLFRSQLAKQLKLDDEMTAMITGETRNRAEVLDDFNAPVGSRSAHLLFLQVKAGGVAITIDSADDMVLIDEKDADSMEQVEDRLHRVSAPRKVRYHYLRSVGTVDVGTALVNEMRDAAGKRLLDERRGVSYARAVLEASGVA